MKQHKDKCCMATQTEDDKDMLAIKILEELNHALSEDLPRPIATPVTMLGTRRGLHFQFNELFNSQPSEPKTYAEAGTQTDSHYEDMLEHGKAVRGELDKVTCSIQ